MSKIEDIRALVNHEGKEAHGLYLIGAVGCRGFEILPFTENDFTKLIARHPWKAIANVGPMKAVIESETALTPEGIALKLAIDAGIHIDDLHIFELNEKLFYVENQPYVIPRENALLFPSNFCSSIGSLEYRIQTVGADDQLLAEPLIEAQYRMLMKAVDMDWVSPNLPESAA